MKTIELTQGKVAMVDDCDYDYLTQWRWCYSEGYAARRDKGRLLRMHTVIFVNRNIPGGVIDHIDRNPLNNCRYNLRFVTHQHNCMNQTPQRNTSSKYKGVCWDKAREKWIVHIKVNKVLRHLGRFDNENEAAEAYNTAAVKLFGEFACLNEVEYENA